MRGRLLEGYSIRAHVPVQAYMDKCEPRRESLDSHADDHAGSIEHGHAPFNCL